jgi:hypothetical protein
MFNRNAFTLFAAVLLTCGLAACGDDDDPNPGNSGNPGDPLQPGGSSTTHSIGGTVSGLAGSLTLQNSNGTTVTVSANGAFTFATQMVLGASYAVTVVVAPNSQTCAVSNGSGSVGLSDITNIAVTCTTNPFLLHATVSGLGAGKSLVLHALADGANGIVTVSANGPVTFPVNFVAGAEYLVFVQTQPQGQTCTVANPEGDIDPVIITNVAVNCINSSASAREWTKAGPVSTDTDLTDANWMDQAQIGYDAAGNALAVWRAGRVGEAGNDIAFSRYTPGSGWSTPGILPRLFPLLFEFSGFDTRNNPRLAVAPNGDAVVIVSWSGAPMQNFSASFYNHVTNTWSDLEWIFLAHPDIPAGASALNVSMDAAGNVVVVFDVSGYIQYSRYKPGDGWITPVQIGKLVSPLVAGVTSAPVLGMNAAGDTICVWRWRKSIAGPPFLEPHLYSSRYDMDSDTWSEPLLVDADDPFDGDDGVYFEKDVMVDAAGNAVAVWTQYDGERLHVMYNRLTGNTWGTPAIVETGNDGDLGNAYDTHAAMDGDGNVMAMWVQNDVDEGHYVANRYVPGEGWGTQQVIGQYAGVGFAAATTEMKLVSNAAGDVVALWTLYSDILPENQFAPYQVVANEFNGTTLLWGAPDAIDKEENETEIGEASGIAVAIDAEGNATAIWRDLGSPESGIRAAHFE